RPQVVVKASIYQPGSRQAILLRTSRKAPAFQRGSSIPPGGAEMAPEAIQATAPQAVLAVPSRSFLRAPLLQVRSFHLVEEAAALPKDSHPAQVAAVHRFP